MDQDYEEAVNELLDALVVLGNPGLSEAERTAAQEWVMLAALRARTARLRLHDRPVANDDNPDEVELDFWVPPHLRPRRPNQRPFPPETPKEENRRVEFPSFRG